MPEARFIFYIVNIVRTVSNFTQPKASLRLYIRPGLWFCWRHLAEGASHRLLYRPLEYRPYWFQQWPFKKYFEPTLLPVRHFMQKQFRAAAKPISVAIISGSARFYGNLGRLPCKCRSYRLILRNPPLSHVSRKGVVEFHLLLGFCL